MRVVALNVWGLRGDWPARRAVLVQGLRQLRPDLIAIQEAVVTGEYYQARDLLGPEFHFAHLSASEYGREGNTEDGQGLSIASRWPLGNVHELELQVTHRTQDFVAAVIVAEVSAPDPIGPVLFVGYGPSWKLNLEYERTLQAVVTARFIEELAGERDIHVVLAGDLNADPDADSILFWSGCQPLDGLSVCYRDAWESARPTDPGHTFTSRNPLMENWDWPFPRIDYIFVRCGVHGGPTLAVKFCDLNFDEPVMACGRAIISVSSLTSNCRNVAPQHDPDSSTSTPWQTGRMSARTQRVTPLGTSRRDRTWQVKAGTRSASTSGGRSPTSCSSTWTPVRRSLSTRC